MHRKAQVRFGGSQTKKERQRHLVGWLPTFDGINHAALLNKLHAFPQLRRTIRGWLKAGVMEGLEFSPTEQGAPQGGAISPLLMNIALHGMETAITEAKYQEGKPILIRYADDFVLLHPNKKELQKAAEQVTTWLEGMGLHLNLTKTRTTHTLDAYEGNVGFDFLGFSIRQHRVGKTHTGKRPNGQLLGFKTHITPSKAAIKRHSHAIKTFLKKRRTAPHEAVIRGLTPIIRGWTNYHKWVICSQAFHVCNRTTYQQLARWGQTRHSERKSKRWTWEKYTIEVDGRRRFGTFIKDDKGNPKPLYVRDHMETHSQDHTKVRGRASPYDGNLIYWAKRLRQHPLMGSKRAKLLALQKGQCPRCGLYFQDGDILEIDHAIPKALGGRDDISNQWVYHRHCHDEKTAEDVALIAAHKAAGIHHT